ncbi:hypothetical protein ACEWY4_027643 [Coilia grayii]|uniref:GIY-YIG domain-containing protein n=1 Tax=Coilia grayii TaxID=363190 RepID=A0ABD1IRY0_9TELE
MHRGQNALDTGDCKVHAGALAGAFKLNRAIDQDIWISPDKTIVNLSQTTKLTEPQVRLLSKGLSFIPSHLVKNTDRRQTLAELTRYHRRLKLASFFDQNEVMDGEITPFLPPSRWEPDDGSIPTDLHELIGQDKETLFQWANNNRMTSPNLTESERRALTSIKELKHIVIKPADKGNATVLMDKTQYVQEARRQLEDPNLYRRLRKPIFTETARTYTRKIQELLKHKYINKKQALYLRGTEPFRSRRFYILPKIHKERSKWPTSYMPPGRPIVSDCGSESYRIAEYIDHFLTPLSTKHGSYIRDTYHFLDKVRDARMSSDTLLFTIDVDSLYTNIDTALGLKAIKEWFRRYHQADRPNKLILELLELNLTHNDFEFNDDYYLQIRGTAMGKKFAPAYANIYMAEWEESVFPKCKKTPTHYYRFLDDIWGTWPYTEKEFKEFILTLNSHHPWIKVKYTLDRCSVDFLDTTTFKGPNFPTKGTLDVRVYFKETDTHALLHKHSFHPEHTFGGIIKSQLTRFQRICTLREHFSQAKHTLFKALRSRGYGKAFLKTTFKEWEEDRGATDAPSQRSTVNRIIPLTIPFSPGAPQLAHLLKRNFLNILGNFPVVRVVTSFRRNKNLRDILVSSTLRKREKKEKVITERRIANNYTKAEGFFLEKATLNQNNCVYLITCRKCKKQYVGQTKNSARSRLHNHSYNIRTDRKNKTHLVRHFKKHGTNSIHMQVLEHKTEWTLTQRLQKEREWIRRLQTKFPLGLNERRD